jgi:hypothetical protein
VAAAGDVLVVNMMPRSLSGERNQDSEPFLAVNPANPMQMVGSAFTPDPLGGPNAPVYVSLDGGNTWTLRSTVLSNQITGDITIAYSRTTNTLYTGILKRPGNLLLSILRTLDPSMTVMTQLTSRGNVDQPFMQANTVGTKDRVYVGNNDFNAGTRTATVDVTLDGASASPVFVKARIESRGTGSAGQDGPQIRVATHASGTVYAAFYGWRSFSNSNRVRSDIVVVRDDRGGGGAAPFTALLDPGDNLPGRLVARDVSFVWNDNMGNQRLGGDLSIAVDPNNSRLVYLAWADRPSGAAYTLHVRRSADGGATWSPADLRTVANATNPALAINSAGKVAFLYQQHTGGVFSRRWQTTVERTTDAFATRTTTVLARTPAGSPAPVFQPYIGDYVYLLAVGKDFHGIFSANNRPDAANFPSGVKYQRNADFAARRLLANNGTTTVPASIDPFYFKLSE